MVTVVERSIMVKFSSDKQTMELKTFQDTHNGSTW